MGRWLTSGCFAATLAACAAPPALAPTPAAKPIAPAPQQPAGDYRRSLGLVTAPAPGVACFSGRTLKSGAGVLVFEEGATAVADLKATGVACPPERGGHGIDIELKDRTVLDGRAAAVETIAVGVIASGEGVHLLGRDSVDLDGDGSPERFASCTSTEGVHLTVWSGPVGESARLWHTYVYLGFDTEPTCTEAETIP